MTVHVQSVSGSLLVYELDDNTPIRRWKTFIPGRNII